MPDETALMNERGASPLDVIMTGARLLTVFAGVILILAGVVYAVQVFQAVGGLLRDPAGLQAPVETMAKIIGAEKLEININGQPLAIGGVVSLLLMFLWYAFWAWIPLAIIAAGGRLVAAASQLRDARNRV